MNLTPECRVQEDRGLHIISILWDFIMILAQDSTKSGYFFIFFNFWNSMDEER